MERQESARPTVGREIAPPGRKRTDDDLDPPCPSGAPNAAPWIAPVVLNEILYHPAPGAHEFIELHNRTNAPIELYDGLAGRSWRLDGVRNLDDTADFAFAPGDTVPARGYLLVVPIDPAQFRAAYAVPLEVSVIGPYGGALDNAGERVALYQPFDADLLADAEILLDAVRYNDKAPWPSDADGGGPALERIDDSAYANDPTNWAASVDDGGTPGRANSVGPPPADPADFDGDGDVDLGDYLRMQDCFTDPGMPVVAGCEAADLDGDGDADLADLIVFQARYTGAR